MQLEEYFHRIGYPGPVAPTVEVLRAVHSAHAHSIPYENLDVIRQVPVDQDVNRIFRKIVQEGRGGWCYEMNGLLGWALGEIGFDVKRICGGVMRAMRGDDAFGNHLVLKVELDGPWIADVGLGDGIFEPIRLRAGEFEQHGQSYRLEELLPGEWRLHNREGAMPPSFDFLDSPADEEKLARTCAVLQEDPASMFRQNLVCQRMAADGGHMLLGRVLTRHFPAAPRRLLSSEDELRAVLIDVFGIRVPDLSGLWDQVVARHDQIFGTAAPSAG